MRTLKVQLPRMRGVDVEQFQTLLSENGFDPGSQDGIYGSRTEAACKAFQRANGLTVDGICGPKTWEKIAPSGGVAYRTLKLKIPRMRGDDVKEFQWLVIRNGFDAGQVDGIYGKKAVSVCKAFQRANGLLVDGICGPVTWTKLRAIDETVVDRLLAWGFIGMVEHNGLTYAVKQYQAAMGLTPDGVIGKNTTAALEGTIIEPRIDEEQIKCQCVIKYPSSPYCDGYPKGKGAGASVLLLAERIFREVEKAYPNTLFYVAGVAHDPSGNGAQIAGGYRCYKWNRERGGASGSKHKECIALDLWGQSDGILKSVIRKEIEAVALRMNGYGGVGYNGKLIVHVDTRGNKARWSY